MDLSAAVAGATAAHRRLASTLEGLTDEMARRPSRLPGWSIGHVLTHLARNADSHVRMLEAALRGESVEQYPGGPEQRAGDIEAGSGRAASELVTDVATSAVSLETTWARMTTDAWRGSGLSGGEPWPCAVLPFHRWREVEIHHVDLGLSYDETDWPDEYVERELPLALAALPQRVSGADVRRLLSWLIGRSDQPDVSLAPWQSRPAHYQQQLDERVLTVFRSRLRADAADYPATSEHMEELARAMPGFIDIKTFTAEDGERVSVVMFESPETQAAWRLHPEHREVQRQGRQEFYDSYAIQVCRIVSERSFP